jgi:DNA adenine methylase
LRSTQSLSARPFLRWPGGKRWLAPILVKAIAARGFRRYFEPFLGSGAVFFGLDPGTAVLSDINSDLVATFVAVRDHHVHLVRRLKRLEISSLSYYNIRAQAPVKELDRATRFLYLNRTAFSGMYRVNKRGEFNVPFGGDRPLDTLWRDGLLRDAAARLKRVEVVCADFEAIMLRAGRGDVVYCDPIYNVTSEGEDAFRRYNKSYFSWEDQQRLAQAVHEAVARGAAVAVSNVWHVPIRRLYPGARVRVMERVSTICPNPSARRVTREYLLLLGFDRTGVTVRSSRISVAARRTH